MTTCKIDACPEPPDPPSNFCVRHRLPRPGETAAAAVRAKPVSADSKIVCPHCQTRGKVRTKRVKRKQGVSGGKATGAVLTAGLSLFATGLSRKQTVTEARCGSCGVTWTIG